MQQGDRLAHGIYELSLEQQILGSSSSQEWKGTAGRTGKDCLFDDEESRRGTREQAGGKDAGADHKIDCLKSFSRQDKQK